MKNLRLIRAMPAFALAGYLIAQIASAGPLFNAWQVDDSAGNSVAYTNILNSSLRTASTNAGFDFSVTSRFVTDYGMGNQTMIMIYGDGTMRWEILWSLTNGDLVSQLITNLSPVQSLNFIVTTNGTGRASYHTHEIIYDPATRLASYVMDGQVLVTNWAGAAAGGYNAGQVQWGSGSSSGEGAMNFHAVSFIITNGAVANYDAGTEPTNALNPVTQGWRLSPSSPPSGTHTNAISPDRGPNVVINLADNGLGSLRQTIADVRPGDTITFFTNSTITLTSGELLIADDLTIAGPGPTNLTVSGNNASRVFHINGGVTASISGLRIDKGRGPTDGDGGGFYNSGRLTLSNCLITASRAGTGTRGSDGADGEFGQIDGGSGGNGSGGGTGGDGGGVFNAGTLTLLGCTLTNNSAGTGGVGGDGGDAYPFLAGSGGNGGRGGNGGNGGAVYSPGKLTLTDCLLAANARGSSGSPGSGGAKGALGGTVGSSGPSGNAGNVGGVLIFGGTNIFSNCTFSTNSGGGILNYYTLTINNTTVSGNSTADQGGGIINFGTLTINNSTISGNSALSGSGGGVYNTGTLLLTNTIVAGNLANSSPNITNQSGSVTAVNCLTTGNPILAPLGNYGGPMQTMPPLAGSPAIDAGLDSVTSFLATDQRGYSRKSSSHVDIGAVEAQIASANNPPLLTNPTRQVNGALTFSFTNIPDADFRVLTSTNIALPLSQWIILGWVTQSSPGQYQFTDPSAGAYSRRFYQVVSP